MATVLHRQAESWIALLFGVQAATQGGVIRREVGWVEREIGRARFEREVRRRGYHPIECGGQVIVICNASGLRVIC